MDYDVAEVYEVDVIVGGEGVLLLEGVGLEPLIQESSIYVLDLQGALQLWLGDLVAICGALADIGVIF